MDLKTIYDILSAKSKQKLQDGIVDLLLAQAKEDLESSYYCLLYPSKEWGDLMKPIEEECSVKLQKLFQKDIVQKAKNQMEEFKNGSNRS